MVDSSHVQLTEDDDSQRRAPLRRTLHHTDHEESTCELCEEIKEVSQGDWCFKWLNELREWKYANAHTPFDRQVHFMPSSADDLIGKLRAKLASLQTEMPAWQLIDKIKQHAVVWALKLERDLLKEDLAPNTTTEDFPGPLDPTCVCVLGSPALNRSLRDKKWAKNILTSFVEHHVFLMLEHLYNRLNAAEQGLTEKGHKMPTQQNGYQQDAEYWYHGIYTDPDTAMQPKLVGPLGERPLHVCCLSAYRFEGIDFKKQGNFVREGILSAIKRYLDDKARSPHDPRGEAYVGYGKDYCAAVGSAIARQCLSSAGHFGLDFGPDLLKCPGRDRVDEDPPYWKELIAWYLEHHKNWTRQSGPMGPRAPPARRQSLLSDARKEPRHEVEGRRLRLPRRDMHALVTCGIYEAETILYFVIAAGDRATLHWLLRRPQARGPGAGSPSPARPSAATLSLLASGAEARALSLVELPLRGLFFRPMHRHSLTSLSLVTGWHYYLNLRRFDTNSEASSNKSYFGLSPIAFAASQGNVDIFDMILEELEDVRWSRRDFKPVDVAAKGPPRKPLDRAGVRRMILDEKDEYGNTLLHLAAWNDKRDLFDRLMALGADARALNNDGLTAFTLTARYGVWGMFKHVWSKHMSATVWRFGNVSKEVVDHSYFDWKGLIAFDSRSEAQLCLDALVNIFNEQQTGPGMTTPLHKRRSSSLRDEVLLGSENSKARLDFEYKFSTVKHHLDRLDASATRETARRVSVEMVSEFEEVNNAQSQDREAMSVVRLITLFRPQGWHKETKDLLQEVVMRKWARGYHLVHLGQNVIPYCIILALFGIMWLRRQLDVLEHDFWWAQPDAVARLKVLAPGVPVLSNPVRADLKELRASFDGPVMGSSVVASGRLPQEIGGAESSCGWGAIRGSSSGALQAVLVLYGVPSLWRLAWSQRRIRPTDLDENQDSRISFDEMVNFLYFNLESLLHIIMSGLLITIGAARVSAGEECDMWYVRSEKSATAMAALFLFINLFIVCKPYKGIGLLVLSIYQFLVTDVFNFLLMYSIFFTAFLLGLQTLHNANHVYLSWMEITTSIAPQISLLTGNLSYLVNANIPEQANQLIATHMAVDGCQRSLRTIYDTAFTLLEISFGDGLADGLQEARRQDYVCPGFNPDGIVGYVIVFWVFLTNILVLNMLIAMMNTTLNVQTQGVGAVWLLDVSYRIMRYEQIFPELTDRMQRNVNRFSLWSRQYWETVFWDTCLALYCVPEMHLLGFTRAAYFKCKSVVGLLLRNEKEILPLEWESELEIASMNVEKRVADVHSDAKGGFKGPKGFKPWNRSIGNKIRALGKRNHTIKEILLWSQLPGAKGKSQHLMLVSLIYQLDLIIRSFDESRTIQNIKVDGEEKAKTRKASGGGNDVKT